jgi:class 3 adenylate cyclase
VGVKWLTIADFGVSGGMREARASTVRAVNIFLFVLCLLALGSTVGTAVEISTQKALVQIIFFLVYALTLVLNGAGFHGIARWMAIVVAASHFVHGRVTMGPGADTEFYLVAIAYAPLLVFTRAELKQTLACYAVFALAFVGSSAWLAYHSPIYALDADVLAHIRAFVLTILCVFTGLTVYHYRSTAIDAQIKLHRANERLHELLTNTLPQLIADRLDKGERVIADSHAEATVLFADLVGFSEISKRLSPSHVVELLNSLFSGFDEAASRHGVEKIKTIGDCYMAATGVLAEGGRQVEAMADFALEMPAIVRAVGEEFGQPLEVRIGISTGPVISGVIGRRKFAYDLWGDTVNLASRMESGGERGLIQVTEATYWRLRKSYCLENRGVIAAKGYPNTPVYALLGRIDEVADARSSETGEQSRGQI